MDAAKDIAEFLTSRRARITPEQVGLPSYGPRRVKGLRREEVASLAGVSVEYYKRLERGNAGGGISNFMPDHLETLLERTEVVPAVNQIESHPYFVQADVVAANDAHGIVSQAWSPIGGITAYRGQVETSTVNDPAILAIAERYDKTAAQVMLRWHLQRGRAVIPKSVRPQRIRENVDVFDFDLAPEELDALDALDTGVRGGPEPDAITLEEFGRAIPEA